MKVFWDTNLFVYLIERHPTFFPKVLKLYQSHRSNAEQVVTSSLTFGELIAQPLRKGRRDLVERYSTVLATGSIEIVDFTLRAARVYGDIRSQTSLKQPDAIQLACAVAGGASRFFTNDQQLWNAKIPGLESIQGI